MRIAHSAMRLALVSISVTVLVSACSSGSSVSRNAASAAPAAASASPAPASASEGAASEGAASEEAASPEAGGASEEALAAAGVNAPPAEGIEAELASLAMYPTARTLYGWLSANGQTLKLNNSTAGVYLVINCQFGCNASHTTFNLPTASGPLASLGKSSDNPGPLDWKILVENAPIAGDDGPRTVYPNQVFFTGAPGERLGLANLNELGFTKIDLGEQVGPGISAWVSPSSWPVPINPVVSEMRLFTSGKPLPAGWIPADGRVVPKKSKLGAILESSGFVRNGEVRAPLLAPVGNYSWAIAQEGEYPMFD